MNGPNYDGQYAASGGGVFDFAAGEQVTATADEPVEGPGSPNPALYVDGEVVDTSPFPGTLSYTFTSAAAANVFWVSGGPNVTWTVSCQVVPTGKDQCKHGGHEEFGFKNQGACVSWVARHGTAGPDAF